MAASFLRPSTYGSQDQAYLRARFSSYSRPVQLAALWLLDVREMRKIEQLILHGSDTTVMSFKGSQNGAVGMVAVASAIISQLSSTTLQIPALSSINWTASAFIITGLLFSILATMLSCIQQQVLGTLNEPGGVRMWLSSGSSSRSGSKHGKGGHPFTRSQDRDGMQTSVAALLLLRLPNAFLLYGVTCFLLGFGLFLGFAWRQDLDNTPSRDNNMAVMIMYIAVGGVSVLGAAGVVKWKMAEVDQAEKIVGKDLEEGDHEENGDGSENGSRAGNQQEDSGSEGEADGLLGKTKSNGKYSPREAMNHERIAEALEDAARAHRELAKLMKNAIQDRQDD